jgi:hypothetical protein
VVLYAGAEFLLVLGAVAIYGQQAKGLRFIRADQFECTARNKIFVFGIRLSAEYASLAISLYTVNASKLPSVCSMNVMAGRPGLDKQSFRYVECLGSSWLMMNSVLQNEKNSFRSRCAHTSRSLIVNDPCKEYIQHDYAPVKTNKSVIDFLSEFACRC